jgi:hypothetical protein
MRLPHILQRWRWPASDVHYITLCDTHSGATGFGPVEIKRDEDGYWDHPGIPAFDNEDPAPYTKHRGLLVQVFAFAVAKGLCDRNSADLTLVKKEAEKRRQRHTVEGLNKILEYVGTPIRLKRAIRLGLLSLQWREDIVV